MFKLILSFVGLALAVGQFTNHKVYQFTVKDVKELAFLKSFTDKHELNLDVWTEHPNVGLVDV